jgi:hypothetical protein
MGFYKRKDDPPMFITEGNVVSFIMVDAIMRYQVQVDVT